MNTQFTINVVFILLLLNLYDWYKTLLNCFVIKSSILVVVHQEKIILDEKVCFYKTVSTVLYFLVKYFNRIVAAKYYNLHSIVTNLS